MSIAAELVATPPAYLSFDDAGAYIGTSGASIKRLVAAGSLTPYRPVGGRTVVARAELDLYMQSVANGECRRGAPTHATK